MISRVCAPATNRLLLPLTALGTVTAVVLLKARFGRAVRRIINTVDSIQPTEEEVASSILHQSSPQTTPPLLPSQVEDYIQESDERPVVAGAERTVHWAKNSRHQKTRHAVRSAGRCPNGLRRPLVPTCTAIDCRDMGGDTNEADWAVVDPMAKPWSMRPIPRP